MAKKKNEPVRTTLEEVNESLSTAAQRLESNKKYISWALYAVAAIVVLIAAYVYLYRNPNLEKARDMIGKADVELLQGDTEAALADYQKVANAYSNKPAERAHLNAAILLFDQKTYKEAAQYLEKYDPDGNLVGPASQSLLGDCYVNMDQLDKALAAFDKAIELAKDNDYYKPTFMVKKATVLHAQKKYDQELKIYEDIRDNYYEWTQIYRFSPEKYIERAKAAAGK